MPKTTTTTFRVSEDEKALIQNFAKTFAERGGVVLGKKPTVSNMTALLWMLICNRDLAITDPVSRSKLSQAVVNLRNIGSNLNGLMHAYKQGLVFEKFDNGEEFLGRLHDDVLSIKKELEVVVRVANGNRKIAIDGLMAASTGE